MLSKPILRCIHIATTMQYICGGGPYKWNSKTNGIEYVNSKIHFVFCMLHFLVSFSYIVFLFARLIQFQFFVEEYSLSLVVQLAYNLASYLMPTIIQIQNFLFWREMTVFINCYTSFYEEFKERFLVSKYRGLRLGCEKTLSKMFVIAALITIQNIVLIFRKPGRIYFATSLLSDPKAKNVLKFLIIFYQFWVWFACWSQILFYCSHMFAFPFAGIFILREMRARKPDAKTSDVIRSPKMFPQLYRKMQVLQVLYQYHFRSWLMPSHKTVLMYIATVSTYGAIRLTGPRATIMALTATAALLYMSVLFRKMGQYYEVSRNTLHSWKGHSKYIRNFVKSSQLMKMDIGSFYFVTKTTVLVVWSTVLNFTISLLLG